MGPWQTALWQTIVVGYIPLLLFCVWMFLGDPPSQKVVTYFLGVVVVTLAYYLFFSVVGWLLVGLPSYWLVCRYAKARLEFAVIPLALFSIACYLTIGAAGLVFSFAALVQCGLFCFLVSKSAA